MRGVAVAGEKVKAVFAVLASCTWCHCAGVLAGVPIMCAISMRSFWYHTCAHGMRGTAVGMGKVGAGAAFGVTFPCPARAPLSFRAICGRCNVRRENAHPPVPHMCLGGGDKGGKGGKKWVKWPDFAFSPPRLPGEPLGLR
jgi:hypothetical protein